MTEVLIEPFAQAHLDGLIALVGAEGWTEYTEGAERTQRALSARGVTTLVALADGRVVGAIQVQSDGVIQAHVSMLLIDREWRGRRLGSRLLSEGLERAGGLFLDIRTRAETDPREGGDFRIVMVRDGKDILHQGTYLEIDPPTRLVFTWSSPGTGHRDSVVTATFEALESGSTIVEIHQVGLPDEESRAGHTEGWTDALAELSRASSDRAG